MATLTATPKAGRILEIRALIDGRDDAVERALVVVYGRQTAAEQASDSTSELNGRGFSGVDAEFGSSLARQVLAGRRLSPRQLKFGRRIARKYARQLLQTVEKTTA